MIGRNPLRSRHQAALRSKRLQAAIQPPAHCLSATALCYAPACGLRVPMRSRSARFVASLRSRSVVICLVAPVPLVGVALVAGAPAPLCGLSAARRHTPPARSCGLRPLGSLRSPKSGASRPRPPLRFGRRYARRQRGSSDAIGMPRCSSPSNR